MSVTKRIAKNTTVLSIATIIGYILGLFTTLYTARYLGAEGFGIISLALSLTAIFGIVIDMGLNTLIVREIARNKGLKDKYVNNIIFMKLALSFLAFGLIILTTSIFRYSSEVSYIIYIIAFSVIFTAFTNIFYSIFQSYQKMEYQSIGTIINAVLMLSGVIIAIFYNLNIFAFAYIYFIVTLVILAYSLIVYSWKFTLPKLSVDFGFWKPTLKEALPFAVVGVFTMIYF